MNMNESIISVLENWKNFSGRACRSEFWYFFLFSLLATWFLNLIEIILDIYDPIQGYGPLSIFFTLIMAIPTLAVTSRRLQDIGVSGWWQLSYFTVIGIFVIIILNMLPAKEDENKWGRNPLLDLINEK